MRWFPKAVLGVVVVGTCISALGAWHPWHTGEPRPYMAARAQMSSFAQAIETYQREHGSLPDALERLTEAGATEPYPLMKRIPLDPWGSEYAYRVLDAQRYEIRSCGEDGLPDTEDDLLWPEEGEESGE